MEDSSSERNHNDQLVLDDKQAVWLVSALLLAAFLLFMCGYFVGKHQALEQFSHVLDQESIADKIYLSLYSGKASGESYEYNETSTKEDEIASKESVNDNDTAENQLLTDNSSVASQEKIPGDSQKQSQYYATLIGFGSELAAKKYIDKLAKRGFPLLIKERTSATTKGKVRSWYQVITRTYASREELEAVVAILTQREHLKGVRILTA